MSDMSFMSDEEEGPGSLPLTGDADIDEMLRRAVKTMSTKGKEYTVGSTDRLANFRGVAQDVGIPMEKVWYTFANKHWRAIQSYIKNGCRVQSEEGISGRIMDVIVYMLLFHKISKEIETMRKIEDEKQLRLRKEHQMGMDLLSDTDLLPLDPPLPNLDLKLVKMATARPGRPLEGDALREPSDTDQDEHLEPIGDTEVFGGSDH